VNAFARLGDIIRNMVETLAAGLSGLVVPQNLIKVTDDIKIVADNLMSVLDVMKAVAEVDAGNLGKAGWSNLIGAAQGMLGAAGTLGIGVPAPATATVPSGSDVTVNGGRGSDYTFIFDGPIYATTPAQAEQSANALASQITVRLAKATRKTKRKKAKK
jgi:hypothetical protein